MYKTGEEVRLGCREGCLVSQTSGMALGYVQTNLVILPNDWAYDFLLFAQRNPKSCPVLEVGEVGDYMIRFIAESADVRTDLPKYRLFRYGKMVEEITNIRAYWQDDLVYFLLGCSFSFEESLLSSGLEVRHISEGVNVPMFKTSMMCKSAGRFKDTPVVVTMRPFKSEDVIKAVSITRDYPGVHGAPVHIGNPEMIGIEDLNTPDWGDKVSIAADEIPVFWACGVTSHMAATVAAPPLMITHAPGHMFVGDKRNYEYRI